MSVVMSPESEISWVLCKGKLRHRLDSFCPWLSSLTCCIISFIVFFKSQIFIVMSNSKTFGNDWCVYCFAGSVFTIPGSWFTGKLKWIILCQHFLHYFLHHPTNEPLPWILYCCFSSSRTPHVHACWVSFMTPFPTIQIMTYPSTLSYRKTILTCYKRHRT